MLTMFAVLCLTVFALLSLSTVRADQRLGDATAEAVEAYYAADCKAQELLARLRHGELPAGVEVETSVSHTTERVEQICTYAVPLSETQELQVAVEVRGTNDFTVLRWQLANVGDWEIDDAPGFWNGEDDLFE